MRSTFIVMLGRCAVLLLWCLEVRIAFIVMLGGAQCLYRDAWRCAVPLSWCLEVRSSFIVMLGRCVVFLSWCLEVRSTFIVMLGRCAVPLSSYLEGAQFPCRHVLKERSTIVVMIGTTALAVPLSSCSEGEHCQSLYRQAWNAWPWRSVHQHDYEKLKCSFILTSCLSEQEFYRTCSCCDKECFYFLVVLPQR